jgi:hypothetical protein
MQPSPTDPAPAGGGEPLVAVYVTTAVRTSDGPGPGVKRVPPDEAGRLVGDRRAVYGEQPPFGFADGYHDPRTLGLMMPRNG